MTDLHVGDAVRPSSAYRRTLCRRRQREKQLAFSWEEEALHASVGFVVEAEEELVSVRWLGSNRVWAYRAANLIRG